MTRDDSVEPTVSLVVCTRNRGAYLPQMLASLEHLITRRLLEIVFVDNGSTDDTAEILRSFQARTALPVRIVYEGKPGLSNARNAGLSVVRGEIVAFTDDDCYPDPAFIEALGRIFDDNEVDVVGGPLVLHDPTDHWVSTTRNISQRITPAGGIVPPGEIAGGCMAFRRAVFDTAGRFDPELGAGTRFPIEDAEMVARACLRGHPVGFFPDPRVRHHHRRKHAEGEALARRFAHGRGAFWARMLLDFPDHRGPLLRHWYWTLCAGARRSGLSGVAEFLRELGGAARYVTRARNDRSLSA